MRLRRRSGCCDLRFYFIFFAAGVVGRRQRGRQKYEQLSFVVAVRIVDQYLFVVLLHGNAVIVHYVLGQVDVFDQRIVRSEAHADRAAHVEGNVQVLERDVIVERPDAQLLLIAVRTVEHADLRVFRIVGFGSVLTEQIFIGNKGLPRVIFVAV